MSTRGSRMEEGGWQARSVLECGGPPPLSHGSKSTHGNQSARGLAQSKTSRWFAALFVFTALPLRPVFGQSYSIDWHTMDGGGSTSTGGLYSVSGTVGQPDAGVMSGGNYTLQGGFWGIVNAIQMPDAPLPSIRLTGTNTVVVSWPSPSAGFSLQQAFDLNTPTWNAPAENITDNGTNKFIIVNPPTGNRYYRLFKP